LRLTSPAIIVVRPTLRILRFLPERGHGLPIPEGLRKGTEVTNSMGFSRFPGRPLITILGREILNDIEIS